VPRGARLTLALSGGIDSAVLLDLVAPRASRLGLRLACVHFDHGLSPHAPAWARFCRRLAARYGLACRVRKLDLAPHRKLGREGAARAARYAALRAERADFIALAQHLDDQAETVLLQLVRGAGAAGLAGMPAASLPDDAGPRFVRPLLDVTRAEIAAYARARGLEWVEDESNRDETLARNFLRRRVLPLLTELNPAAVANLGRSARHLGEAAGLLAELAATDAERCVVRGVLDVAALGRLGAARARNLLRWFLQRHGVAAPSSVRLDEILRQAAHARADRGVAFDLDGTTLRRYKGALRLVPPSPASRPPGSFEAVWSGARPWPVPELGGVLRLEPVRGTGLRAAAVRRGRLTLRPRRGGEALRPRIAGPRRTVKRLLQESGVPPWDRVRLPLVYVDEALACVPGVAVAAELQAGPGEPGLRIEWTPLAPEAAAPGAVRKPVKRAKRAKRVLK